MESRAGSNGSNESQAPQRLVDETGAGGERAPAEAWAVGLLREAAPYQAPAGRKQRVQLALGRMPRRRLPLVLRVAVVGVLMIGCGAIARAALGEWPRFLVDVYQRFVPADAPAAAPQAAAAGKARGAKLRGAELDVAAPAAPEPAPQPAPEAPSALAPPAAIATGGATALARRRAPGAPAAASSEDTAPVLEAMRALRVEHNPARARVLLNRYLARHPNGRLAEEALALSIEAAAATGDTGAASASAARYLRLYPKGPFRVVAQQAAGQTPR